MASWIYLALLVMLATHSLAEQPWRSALYPEDWQPGFRDSAARFLHDFSYAGYHRGERPIPEKGGERIDVTRAPYLADATGAKDSTSTIQAALDDAAKQGGGIVYLPPGTYRVQPPEGKKAALTLQGDHIVLRGAGVDKTFICNSSIEMREKCVLEIKSPSSAWWFAEGEWVKTSAATQDFRNASTVLPVSDSAMFAPGDLVIVRNDLTERFIGELGMTGKWTRKNMKNRALVFCRRITAVNPEEGTVTIDVPLRYELRKEDGARVLKLGGHMITEVGLEDFSIGMRQRPGEMIGEHDVSKKEMPAYEVHQSHAIIFNEAENCWIRRVNSYAPEGNSGNVHVLSNGLKLERSRLVTVEKCDWRHSQYKGGGGNGYLYTMHGNDCLIRDSHAEGGRHNYDFGGMYTSGNAIVDCVSKDGLLGSDFHMFFSVSNLFDNITCDGDWLEARYRPYGGTPEHGVTTSQSVFWNTNGVRYPSAEFEFDGKIHKRSQYLVLSQQFGNGYVIGTRGPDSKVKSTNFVEGVGRGDTLQPRSLYLDQLERRLR